MKYVKQSDASKGFPFIAFIPENTSANPAILFQLHGAGERGKGGEQLEKVLYHGFTKIVTDENLKDCILICPQCPPETFWAAKIESIKSFIDQMIEDFSADKNRIYLAGLSMGGFGTWYSAMAYPNMFAAIVPCCGGGMDWNAEVLKMPIWTFHGLADTVVSPEYTKLMITALEGRNPNFKYTLYDGVGHNSWENAFCVETLEWILSQHK